MQDFDIFFSRHYCALRQPHDPMRWMRRMFNELINGKVPSVVDLPTASGKTDVVVIWLLALAWYAQNRDTANPIPRRLVWVVNRRVLVQQVDRMAKKLTEALQERSDGCGELANLLRGLCLNKDTAAPIFSVVQLRGQRLDDREWTLDPTTPQLIIGTVDQIGSRLLFQGYGLGKWSRPLHAGLLGVDAWVCVDEAHLVPAFVATLRQIREIASRPIAQEMPEHIKAVFSKLPLWISELSATPGLPKPKFGAVYGLHEDDRDDPVIKDRLCAKQKRHVLWDALPKGSQLAADLAKKALGLKAVQNGGAVAVFCSKVKDAEAVAKELEKKHKVRVLLVTGRVRGYERDQLVTSELFKRFRGDKTESADNQPAFLVGTAAAEVGLDADADAIVCDFAPLPTLIQRLGRLDRIGHISKRLQDDSPADDRPTMHIIGGEKGKTNNKELKGLSATLSNLERENCRTCNNSASGEREYIAPLFSGSPWVPKKNEGAGDQSDSDTSDDKSKEKEIPIDDIVRSATWQILSPEADNETTLSANWLSDDLARITPGPVVVPPLTDAVLNRWAATTPPPPHFLPVHPWLYGMLPSGEGTPLIGIAFRLELDVLKHAVSHQDEEDGNDGNDAKTWIAVRKCLSEFPPLRSELHFVSLYNARDWLNDHKAFTLAHFDGDSWERSCSPNALSSASVLVFPTSTSPTDIDALIPKSGGEKEDAQRCWDVFDALAKDGAKYRREVSDTSGGELLKRGDGVWRVPDTADTDEAHVDCEAGDSTVSDKTYWKSSRTVLRFSTDGIAFQLRYFRPKRENDTGTVLLADHASAVACNATQLAAALAPDNHVFAELLHVAGLQHDTGKDHAKWQSAMGNRNDSVRIAKPVVENPGTAGGYRHEWGSLCKIKGETSCDLVRHLIAAHHGWFRPSMPDKGFDCPPTASKQNPERLEATIRYAELQASLGYWRLAYLEALLKTSDAVASRDAETPEEEQ